MTTKKQSKPPVAKKVPDNVVRFSVSGTTYEIDPQRLTLGETSEVESHFDKDFAELHGQQGLLALVYIAMRRKDDSVTWAEVGNIEIRQVDEASGRPTSTPETTGSQS